MDFAVGMIEIVDRNEKILEWVAMPFTRGSSQPRDWTWVSHIAGRFFTIWANMKDNANIRFMEII